MSSYYSLFNIFCRKINEITKPYLKTIYSIIMNINKETINIFDSICNVLLLFIQILFIFGIFLFHFTEISILGGWTKFTYIIISLIIIIKMLLTFRKYYISDNPTPTIEKTFDNELKFYESIHKLFINMPSDIPFIVLLSTTLSMLIIISKDTIVFRKISIILLSILLPILLLFLLLLLGHKYLYASKIMYGNIFYLITYIIIYFILIIVIIMGIKPIINTMFTNINNLNDDDIEEHETLISQQLSERFLIFSDPSLLYRDNDNDSSYYYIIGIIFYFLLLISQTVIIYLFFSYDNVKTVTQLFKFFIEIIYEYLELPITKEKRLKFQEEKMANNLEKIKEELKNMKKNN